MYNFRIVDDGDHTGTLDGFSYDLPGSFFQVSIFKVSFIIYDVVLLNLIN